MPGFLLVVVDCLRADLLSRPRDEWPNATRLVAGSAWFANAYTTCPTTTPAFTSLFTSRPPTGHGVRSLRGARLSEEVATLPEELARAGWDTWASVTGPLMDNVGLLRGFADVEYREVRDRSVHRGAWSGRVLERLREGAGGGRPFLGLVHLWDLHTPRTYPRAYDDRRYGRTAYERSFGALDEWLGRLVEVAGPTTIVLTGDHGENVLLEPRSLRQQGLARRLRARLPVEPWAARLVARGARSESKLLLRLAPRDFWNHNQTLFEGDVRVPLVFAGPGLEPGVRSTPVSHLDLAPTLLELAGLPAPAGLAGTSLASALRAGGEPPPHPIVMETPTGAPGNVQTVSQAAIRDGSWKLLTSLEDETVPDALYDLVADPEERRNVARRHPDVVERLRTALREATATRAAADEMSAEDDAILAERLEELGYL